MTRLSIASVLFIVAVGLADLMLARGGGGPVREDDRLRRPEPGRFERSVARQPPLQDAGRDSLDAPSVRDPAFRVAIPAETRNSIGTAFSLDRRGTWMTARHVVDGCARVLIVTEPRRGLRVDRTYIHPRADLAILQTRAGATALALTRQKLRRGQTGFHFGFPDGKPAAVQSVLIGRRQMRSVGRYHVVEPVVAWADRVRVPDSHGGLGGISGGPALDANGAIVGVTVAGSKRRGRIYTTALSSIASALDRSGVGSGIGAGQGGGRRDRIDGRNFASIGAALRRRLTVALVYCAAPA